MPDVPPGRIPIFFANAEKALVEITDFVNLLPADEEMRPGIVDDKGVAAVFPDGLDDILHEMRIVDHDIVVEHQDVIMGGMNDDRVP